MDGKTKEERATVVGGHTQLSQKPPKLAAIPFQGVIQSQTLHGQPMHPRILRPVVNHMPPSLPLPLAFAFDAAVLEELLPLLLLLLLLLFGEEIEIVVLTRVVVVPFRSSPSVLLPFGLGCKPKGAQPYSNSSNPGWLMFSVRANALRRSLDHFGVSELEIGLGGI